MRRTPPTPVADDAPSGFSGGAPGAVATSDAQAPTTTSPTSTSLPNGSAEVGPCSALSDRHEVDNDAARITWSTPDLNRRWRA